MEQLEHAAPKPDEEPPSKIENEDPHSSGMTPTDEFMLAEYKNISAAHFDLHQGYRSMFRFYLGIAAIPVTVFAFILKDVAKNASIGALPNVVSYVATLISIIGFLMFLALANIMFEIMFYARTVNGTRQYFTDRALELNNKDLKQYLLLPGDMNFPRYGMSLLQVYSWQYWMIALINSCYLLLSVKNYTRDWPNSWAWSVGAFIAFMITHLLFHFALANRKEAETTRIKPL